VAPDRATLSVREAVDCCLEIVGTAEEEDAALFKKGDIAISVCGLGFGNEIVELVVWAVTWLPFRWVCSALAEAAGGGGR
jgi:hypothetical protein